MLWLWYATRGRRRNIVLAAAAGLRHWLCFAHAVSEGRLCPPSTVTDWLCFASPSPFVVTPPGVSWDAPAGTLQTDPAASIGFVSHDGPSFGAGSASLDTSHFKLDTSAADWVCFAHSVSPATTPSCRDATSCVSANASTGTAPACSGGLCPSPSASDWLCFAQQASSAAIR